MGFSKTREYWSGFPFPPSGDPPNPGIKPASPVASALQADLLPLSHLGTPKVCRICSYTTGQSKSNSQARSQRDRKGIYPSHGGDNGEDAQEMGPEKGSEYVDKSCKLPRPSRKTRSLERGSWSADTTYQSKKYQRYKIFFNLLEENCNTDIMSHSEMFSLQIGKRKNQSRSNSENRLGPFKNQERCSGIFKEAISDRCGKLPLTY